MLRLVSKDSVKISDHFDVLCMLIACMVLEIINQMSKNQKIQSYSVEHCRCNLVMMSPTISRVTSYKIPQQVFLRHLRYLMLANKSVDAILLGGKAI